MRSCCDFFLACVVVAITAVGIQIHITLSLNVHDAHNSKGLTQLFDTDRKEFFHIVHARWLRLPAPIAESDLITVQEACSAGADFSLLNESLGDVGMEGLSAAFVAMPRPLPFRTLDLRFNNITDAGAAALAPGLEAGFTKSRWEKWWRDGWRVTGLMWGIYVESTPMCNLTTVYIGDNPLLGDTGIALLLQALPATVTHLHLVNTNVTKDGLAGLLPKERGQMPFPQLVQVYIELPPVHQDKN